MSIAADIASLTGREREILSHIGEGLSAAQIAERIGRSEKTVRSHQTSLGTKLGVRDRVQLARVAIRAGLSSMDLSHAGSPSDTAFGATDHQQVLLSLESVMNANGDEFFFRNLARQLAVVLDVKCCVLTKIAGADRDHLQSLVFWQCGQFMEDFRIPIEGSACGTVTRQGSCFRPKNTGIQFPEFQQMVDFHIESYLGMALRSSAGQVIGTLCVTDDKPMEGRLAPDLIVRIVGGRAGAELERRLLVEQLRTNGAADQSSVPVG